MSKKPDLGTSEVFKTSVMRVDANAAGEPVAGGQQTPPLYTNLIKKCKSMYDIPGALYIASEVMAFDIPSENYKTVYYDNDAKKFMKTFVDPQPIPLLYNHADGLGSGSMFGDPQDDTPPNVAGRVLSYGVAPGMFGTQSAFAGQVITNKDTIDRVYNLMDYTQSISIMPKGYVCEVCNTDAYSEDCPHMPGQTVTDGKKEKKVVWKLIPNYAAEFSFVLVPGYRNARIVAMEQNGLFKGKAPVTHGRALFSYSKKEGMITVPDNFPTSEEGAEANRIHGYQPRSVQQNSEVDKNHGTMNNTKTFEGELNMEELQKILDSLKLSTESLNKLVEAVTESNKVSTEALAAIKGVAETLSKNAVKEEPAAAKTEPTQAPEQNSQQNPPAEPTAQEKKVEELSAKIVSLEETMKNTLEQNKAILESIQAALPKTEANSAPAGTEGAAAEGNEPAAQTEPDKNGKGKTEGGDGKGEASKQTLGKYKGLAGGLV